MSHGIDFPHLADETRRIWDQNARWWDARMGEGNDWHDRLIAPAVQKLLNLQREELVLDLACENGLFARALAQQGARVLATSAPNFSNVRGFGAPAVAIISNTGCSILRIPVSSLYSARSDSMPPFAIWPSWIWLSSLRCWRRRFYLGLAPETGIDIPGQPERHYYFYRPLSALFSACFAEGFVVDGFEEPGSEIILIRRIHTILRSRRSSRCV